MLRPKIPGMVLERITVKQSKLPMKKRFITSVLGLLLMSLTVSAQVVSKDSIAALNQQKNLIAANKKLNDRKIELASLENQITEKTRKVEQTAERAQRSADENRKSADKLSDDPQNKKYSRRAQKAAKKARKDAKSARKAVSSLESLKKDIESLRKKISEDEAKLSSLSGSR
jgi:peptidoglycan hydrolase CwlO-like protein